MGRWRLAHDGVRTRAVARDPSGFLQEGYAFGALLAAGAYFFIYPHFDAHWGWRVLFFVGGAPALLTLFIRARVREPEAWHRSRTDWATYRRVAITNWRRFLYIVLFLAAMNMISHGSQDLYPRFLQHDRGFSVAATSGVAAFSGVGAILGGVLFGAMSERLGRRRALMIALALGLLCIPLWLFATTTPSLLAGGFLIQFMVQGAWGIVPAHVNELSPDQLRGFFPGPRVPAGRVDRCAEPDHRESRRRTDRLWRRDGAVCRDRHRLRRHRRPFWP